MQWRKMLLPVSVLILLPIIAASTVPSVLAQSTYSWSLACRSSSAGDPGSGVIDWNWTLNGVSTAGNTSYCRSPSATGNGTVPSNANGIIARLTMQLAGQPSCIHEYFVSQPFNPGSAPRIDLKGSCSTTNYGTPVSIKADFKLGH